MSKENIKAAFLLAKVARVVDSCETGQQCDTADKYISQARKHMKTNEQWLMLMKHRDSLDARRHQVSVAMRRPFMQQAF